MLYADMVFGRSKPDAESIGIGLPYWIRCKLLEQICFCGRRNRYGC